MLLQEGFRRMAALVTVLAAFVLVMGGVHANGGPGWVIETVDSEGNVGLDISMAVVNGQPAISYKANSELKYARYNGSRWITETVAPVAGETVDDNSLAEVNGQPAISYYDSTNGELKYARYNGSSWDIETVDSAGGVGVYTSLAVVNGQPAISYRYPGGGELRYARYNGASWDIETVELSGFTGYDTSLAEVNGQPAISYRDLGNDDLKYARFDGSTWQIQIVDNDINVSANPSLAEVNGQPAISYYDTTDNNLKLARFNGSTWQTQTVDSEAGTGLYASLAVVNGQPVISYQDSTNGNLKFARFNGGTWQTQIVDSSAEVGRYTSVAAMNGQPVISYQDFANDNLKFALLDTETPKASGVYTTNVNLAGETKHSVLVYYSDDWRLNPGSLDANDLTITGPGGVIPVDYVRFVEQGYLMTAIYTFTAPGGVWDFGDNGTYTVAMNADQVLDSVGQAVFANPVLTQFTVNAPIGETPLTSPTGTIPVTENIDLVFELPLGAYYTVVDVYYPNGGYAREVIEAPDCVNGVCTVTVPSFGLTGTYGIWAISGFGDTFGTWTFSGFDVSALDVTLDTPSGTVPYSDTLALTFGLPDGMAYTVVDIYYPNGGYTREVVEAAACPGGVCSLSVASYGLSGDYGVWMIPGVGDSFGQWAYSGFTVNPAALALDTVDVLGSAAGPLPALDTSQVEAAVEGPGN